nr:hypothetical protein [uncultured Vibrio sp.]
MEISVSDKQHTAVNEFCIEIQKDLIALAEKWTMPIRNWRQALNRFMIMFEDRLTEYM